MKSNCIEKGHKMLFEAYLSFINTCCINPNISIAENIFIYFVFITVVSLGVAIFMLVDKVYGKKAAIEMYGEHDNCEKED